MLVSQAARLWLKQVDEARKVVSANSQVRGCPAGKIHREQQPEKVRPSGKTGQLCCVVSTFQSKAASRKQWLFTQGVAKAYCLDKFASYGNEARLNAVLSRLKLSHCFRDFSLVQPSSAYAETVSLGPL